MYFYVLCPSFDFHNSQVPICSFIQSVGGKCIKNKKKKKKLNLLTSLLVSVQV